MHRLKYLAVYSLPVTVWIAFHAEGWWTLFPLLYLYGIIPFLELLVRPDAENMDKKLAYDEKNEKIYDWILYLAVPIQVGFLIYFFFIIKDTTFGSIEFIGRVSAMGMMCGSLGINVGHELGHRSNRAEQFLGEILLLTSLNTHFLPYHNAGHHLNVATPNDSATAAKGEWLYTFWITSHFGSYVEAWKIEARRLAQNGKSWFNLNNRMIIYTIANILVIGSLYYFMGTQVTIAFIIAAVAGILLLETVNYIEHYGLLREQKDNGKYERVKHYHSWNSDHPVGRAMLFNLSRHSDHHYNGSKPYQVLESVPESPQMPTGYPGMMLLALFPPLWFAVMNKKVEDFKRTDQLQTA